jgi:four helix bundle protein
MGFNFEELDVYNKAVDLVSNIYSLTRRFPKNETFGLTSQLRRAAVSIAVNISEGSARTKKDFSRFLDISRGSLFECVTLLEISQKQCNINQHEYAKIRSQLTELSKMLSGLKKSITL